MYVTLGFLGELNQMSLDQGSLWVKLALFNTKAFEESELFSEFLLFVFI